MLLKIIISLLDGVENIVGKGHENMLVTSIFSFAHNVLKDIFLRAVRGRDFVLKHLKQTSIVQMALDGNFVHEPLIHDKAAESAGQDQTARMGRLILLYTVRKMNPRYRPAGCVRVNICYKNMTDGSCHYLFDTEINHNGTAIGY